MIYIKLLSLEIKNFIRNPQFGVNLVMKIFMTIGMLYFAMIFIGSSFALYYISKEEGEDPLLLFCRFFVYYWVLDLVIRYFMQPMPTQNIKPFLTLNITKSQLVKYTIFKTITHFFNWGNLLFLIPFGLLLTFDGGQSGFKVFIFTIALLFNFYFNNFLNILLNGKNTVFYTLAIVLLIAGTADYYDYLPLKDYSETVFLTIFCHPFLALLPVFSSVVLAYFVHKMIYSNFYLDKVLSLKKAEGKSENIAFLNQFGVIGTFMNNDIRLIKRSKAAKSAAIGAVFFLLYGLITFSPSYNNSFMQLFVGIFVTGGFMIMFGQRVPAWDSSYYPLMMTQNVPYKEYLMAKWYLIVVAIGVSTIFAAAYILISWELYLTFIAAGLYNLGANSYITLLAGAYQKKPIDLNANVKSFGGGNNFNLKVILLLIPQMIIPMAVFTLVKYFSNIYLAVFSLALLGTIGFLLRNKIFNHIVKIYKIEKYKTIEAYKKS